MVFGDFPSAEPGSNLRDPSSWWIQPGVILDRNLEEIHEVDLRAEAEVQEFVSHSWYQYDGGKDVGLHPWAGETQLDYKGRGGPDTPFKQLNVDDGYSWLKSPRWKGKAMEVGPLARVLLLYAQGDEACRSLVDSTLSTLGADKRALFSTMGRTAARTLETKLIADKMQDWMDALMANIKAGNTRTFNEKLWEPSSWPKEAKGVGFMEAPRGGLSHFIVIKDQKIDNYQAVVPSTWNAGPRDSQNQAGAYEAALEDNHELHDPHQPVEILRTIHSFDPCIACAVHLTDEQGEEMLKVQVR
jgi:hydrogenase large subunit